MKNLFLICCLSAALFTSSVIADEDQLQLARYDSKAAAAAEREKAQMAAARRKTAKKVTNSRKTKPQTSGMWQDLNPKKLRLKSEAALVVDQRGNEVYAKAGDKPRPIASITKLMTAMVTLDGKLPLQQKITITKADRDLLRLTGSRLKYGATLTRKQMLQLALMASENRAAAALGRTYPGGTKAFVKAMNAKARALGMRDSRFADPAGLNAGNVASARDVAKMVRAARKYPLIIDATTTRSMTVYPWKKRGPLRYSNTNRLVKNKNWEIRLSKTGYINEAGRCLAMQAEIVNEPLVIVLLNSYGKLTPLGDSSRIRKWIEAGVNS